MKFRKFQKAAGILLAAVLTVGAVSVFTAEEENAVAIDKEAFDALIASGITADDAEIEASEWASAVKEAGTLRVGETGGESVGRHSNDLAHIRKAQ